MSETYSPAESSASEANKLMARVGEITDSLSFEALDQKPQEGPGFTFVKGRIQDGDRQRYFEVRRYSPKELTPERWELYTGGQASETFTIPITRDKYTYWRDQKLLIIQKGAAMIYPPQEIRTSIDRFAELAQKIKTSAKFS